MAATYFFTIREVNSFFNDPEIRPLRRGFPSLRQVWAEGFFGINYCWRAELLTGRKLFALEEGTHKTCETIVKTGNEPIQDSFLLS
ncbi:MAG TPA: hypothetical protein VF634_02240 [Pyrinomonadaceae bacterium]